MCSCQCQEGVQECGTEEKGRKPRMKRGVVCRLLPHPVLWPSFPLLAPFKTERRFWGMLLGPHHV